MIQLWLYPSSIASFSRSASFLRRAAVVGPGEKVRIVRAEEAVGRPTGRPTEAGRQAAGNQSSPLLLPPTTPSQPVHHNGTIQAHALVDGPRAEDGAALVHLHLDLVGRVLDAVARQELAQVLPVVVHAVGRVAEGEGVVVVRDLRLRRGHLVHLVGVSRFVGGRQDEIRRGSAMGVSLAVHNRPPPTHPQTLHNTDISTHAP